MDDRQHQDIDVVAAKLPTRAVEGQKPRPRSNACDPDDHSGELASVYDDLCEEALETAVVWAIAARVGNRQARWLRLTVRDSRTPTTRTQKLSRRLLRNDR